MQENTQAEAAPVEGRNPESVPLSEMQAEAVARILQWFVDDTRKVFRLFGYAGTGKTTCIRAIVDALPANIDVLYGAYTGKAAHVMRQKGNDGAATLHSLLYRPVEQARTRLRQLEKSLEAATDDTERERLAVEVERERKAIERPGWVLRVDSPVEDCDLLIIDEVSMVNPAMAFDIETLAGKILVLGDPAQLPPVSGPGYYTVPGSEDFLLTEPHRSALDSPVTDAATLVRNVENTYNVLAGHPVYSLRVEPGDLAAFDQVICWTNSARWALIERIRGSITPPKRDDRIVVTRNNYRLGVYNGQQFTVLSRLETVKHDPEYVNKDGSPRKRPGQRYVFYRLRVVDDDRNVTTLDVFADGFKNHAGEKRADDLAHKVKGCAVATFAHAITCHKAQGSQWGSVLVVDQTPGLYVMSRRNVERRGGSEWRAHAHAQEQARAWLYTAVTRAAESVTVVPSGGVL